MPLYEFRCEMCNYLGTYLQDFKSPCPTCPRCKTEMRREITAPAGFNFKKGSGGFYSADNKQTETEVENE